jgi:hypothetical protein
MPIENVRPIIEKLLIKTQENIIEWVVAFEELNYIEYRSHMFITKNKILFYYLEVDEDDGKINFTINFGPIDKTKRYEKLIVVNARLEPILYDLKYLLTNMHNKDLLKYA